MTTKVKVGIGVLCVIAASIALWQLLTGDSMETGSPSAPLGDKPKVTDEMRDEEASTETAAALDASVPETIQDDQRVAVAPTGLFISGTVTEKKTGSPVNAFDLWMTRKSNDLSWARVIHETVKDDQGSFSYKLEKEGLYSLTIRSSRHHPHRVRDLHLSRDGIPVNLDIKLDSGLTVSGSVVDYATGRPIAGALIGATDIPGIGFDATWRLLGFEEHEVQAMTHLLQ